MAEGGDKTEQATPRRRADARRKGQVARSPELSGAAALLAMVLALHALPGGDLLGLVRWGLSTPHAHLDGPAAPAVAQASRVALLSLVQTVGLVILAGCGAGVAASVAQVGLLWTPQPVLPDPNRLNPLAGAARLLGPRGLVEAGKALVKVGVVGWVVYATIRDRLPDLLALITLPTPMLLASLGGLLYTLCLRVSLVFLLIAAGDYAYQRWEYEKNLRMSKEEVRQEHKQSEGDPLIKQQIRQRQRAAARKRMLQDVEKADVVVTNPTHFAVALAYDADTMAAPKVLAKGQDLIAARIRERAQERAIPLLENPPLARALYKQVEVGREIPVALYAAVAEVLAYVYDRDHAHSRISSAQAQR